MSDTTFVVIDHDNDNRKEFDNRSDAEEAADTAREFGSDDVEVVVDDAELDMMAETRAYKRAVKSATGGGIEAFAKEQGDGR